MNDDIELPERRIFGGFEKHDEFTQLQHELLAINVFGDPTNEEEPKEDNLLRKLSNILSEYQEQSYLLDPYLETLVVPVVDSFKSFAKQTVSDPQRRASAQRVERLSSVLYSYMKFRGYKAIMRYFPHEVSDLSIALGLVTAPGGLIEEPSQWALRYVTLVWLALICMIPFDLARFDEKGRSGYTADMIENIAKPLLAKAGMEREGAALLLSRLYVRQDMETRFNDFLNLSIAHLGGGLDPITSLGYLQILCGVAKDAPMRLIKTHVELLLQIAKRVESSEKLVANTLIRKFKIKLASRITLRLLPTTSRARVKGRSLDGTNASQQLRIEEDFEIPEQTEVVLEQLFEALQDRDTIVRWSASKAVARISEALPPDFSEQILDQVLQLFTIHSIASAALYDLPAIAEATWHGACLACAELARRGLISSVKLPELIGWLLKGLYFDIRKGSHSIGSNVRDATAYVFWALARSQDPSFLSPYSDSLAQNLSTVAVFDREIHIRRAVSAAFQEHVGRNNLFPHGIKVLGITDFFSVSVRRNAFLNAAPQVAKLREYREFLLNHLLTVSIRHWDPSIRELASQSVGRICTVDISSLGPQTFQKASHLLESIDPIDIHGALLVLSELARTYEKGDPNKSAERKQEIFTCLKKVPIGIGLGPRNTMVTVALCKLISNTLTVKELDPETTSVPKWKYILDSCMKHRNTEVQFAASVAMGTLSKQVDCTADLERLIPELQAAAPAIQQCLGTLLGHIDYSAYSNGLRLALSALLEVVKPPFKASVETRRNCFFAFPCIVASISEDLSLLSPEDISAIFGALMDGLDDYSVDQRGDVGSWVRIACLRALSEISCILVRAAGSIDSFQLYLPPSRLHDAIGKMLKQGVERLDNVRQEAWSCVLKVYELPLPDVSESSAWKIPGSELLLKLITGGGKEERNWADGTWTFPKAVQLLSVSTYRNYILSGIILSLGSKTESTQRPLASSFVAYVTELPSSSNDGSYNLKTLLEDLRTRVEGRLSNNATVIPILQTLTVLLEGAALASGLEESGCAKSLQTLLALVTKGVSRFKSLPRITESMKIVVNMIFLEPVSRTSAEKLSNFLQHDYPNIRKDTAEYLYIALQSAEIAIDTDEIEEVLLETEWLSGEEQAIREATSKVVEGLLSSV